MKKLFPLLVLAVLCCCLFVASDASAQCLRCSYGQQRCVDVSYPWADYCEWLPEVQDCYLEGQCLARLAESKLALSSEFRVVSVERIDEPSAPKDETRIAMKRD